MSNLPSAPSSNLHPLEEIYGNLKRIRTIFIWFILFIALGLLAGIFISLSAGDIAQAGWVAVGFLPIIAVYYFIQRLNFEAASILLAVVMITLITVVAMNDLGIHHLSVIGYPAILIVASLVNRG